MKTTRRGGKGGAEPRMRIRAREQQVLVLSEQGWTQDAIAAHLNVSQPAVSKILRRVDERALKAIDAQMGALKMRRLRVFEHLSREGRRAWEESKKGRVRRRQKKAAGGTSDAALTQEVVVDEHPDPRMLDQSRKAEEAIAELCGWTGGGHAMHASDAPPAPELTLEDLARRINAILEGVPPDATVVHEPPEPPVTTSAATAAADPAVAQAGGAAVHGRR